MVKTTKGVKSGRANTRGVGAKRSKRADSVSSKKPRKSASAGQTSRTTKGSRSTLRRISGYAAEAKGLRFEQQVLDYYAKRGWHVRPRQKLGGREFDLVGTREQDWGYVEYLLVECKDKARVTPSDVLAFLNKIRQFDARLPTDLLGESPDVEAVLAYTGELPKDAKGAAAGSVVDLKFKKF